MLQPELSGEEMMTGDPAAFLAAQLDKLEATAKAAHPGPWRVVHDYYGPQVQSEVDGSDICDERDHDHHASYATGEPLRRGDCDHIALWGPDTVLRHIDAARKQLLLHAVLFTGPDESWPVCSCCDDGYQQQLDWPCPTIELLAQGYGWSSDE